MKFQSALVTAASGSLGGFTASHNKGGPYLRARTIPTNPNSSFQQVIRSYITTLTTLWANPASGINYDNWTDYAQHVPITDTMGQPRLLPALAMFCRTNVPALQAGLAVLLDAPGVYSVAATGDITFTASEATQEISIAWPEGLDLPYWVQEDNGGLLVYASRPQNPTITYFKGPYRYAGFIPGDNTTPPTSPQVLAAPFSFVEDSKVFCMCRSIYGDGRLSYPFRRNLIAAA